jgi:hypothetical protein
MALLDFVMPADRTNPAMSTSAVQTVAEPTRAPLDLTTGFAHEEKLNKPPYADDFWSETKTVSR